MKTGRILVAVALGVLGAAGVLFADKPEVTPYGFVLVNAGFNTGDAKPFDIPIHVGANDVETFLITPRQTRFGFKMSDTRAMGAKVDGGIELDFYGLAGSGGAGGVTQTAPRLRLAFVKLNWDDTSLLIGQDWVLFAPLAPSSLAHVSLAPQSGSGNLWGRFPQVALEKRVDKIKINVGLLRPFAADGSTVSQGDAPGVGESKGLPFVQARVGVSPSETITVGGNVHFGQLEVADDNDKTFAVAADLALQMGALGLKGEGFVGEGTNMLFSKAGRGVGTTGGWAQVSYKVDKNTCNLSFGMETLDEDDVAAGNLSKNQTILANVIHAAAANTKIAAELGYITTSYKGGDDQNNINLNLALQYAF